MIRYMWQNKRLGSKWRCAVIKCPKVIKLIFMPCQCFNMTSSYFSERQNDNANNIIWLHLENVTETTWLRYHKKVWQMHQPANYILNKRTVPVWHLGIMTAIGTIKEIMLLEWYRITVEHMNRFGHICKMRNITTKCTDMFRWTCQMRGL